MMRDRLLVNLLLAENGIRSETINKRIDQLEQATKHLLHRELQMAW